MKKKATYLLVFTLFLNLCACDSKEVEPAEDMQISTLAGNGTAGNTDGVGKTATFRLPFDVTTDAQGNVYVADYGNHIIRKISPVGEVSTFAGKTGSPYKDGTGAESGFLNPAGITTDREGNLFVTERSEGRIRKISPSGLVTTVAGGGLGYADGSVSTAKFSHPVGIVLDSHGNIFVSEVENHCIRKISTEGVVSTFAGATESGFVNGTSTNARFFYPYGLAIDAQDNLYVADYGNHCVRKITSEGVVSTYAGSGVSGFANGPAAEAQFNTPKYVAVDARGAVYVTDVHAPIRKIAPDGTVSNFAGSLNYGFADGAASVAMFQFAYGLAFDAQGNLYVADSQNHSIRKVTQ